MAEEQSVILDIEVDLGQSIKNMDMYKSRIQMLKKEQKELKEQSNEIKAEIGKLDNQYKKGRVTQAEYTKQITLLREAQEENNRATGANRIELERYKTALKTTEKEVKNAITANNENVGSLKAMRAELSSLTAAYDAMGAAERDSAQGKDLLAKLKEMNEEVSALEQVTGRFQRNVGNYPKISTELERMINVLANMKIEGQENTEEYKKLTEQAEKMRDAYNDVRKSIIAGAKDTASLDAVIGGLQNLMGIWATFTVISEKLGIENEELNKAFEAIAVILTTLTTVQGVINALQSQSIIIKKAEAIATWAQTKANIANTAATSANATAMTVATAAAWSFTAALLSNPVVAITVALVALVGGIYGVVKAFQYFNGVSEEAKEHIKNEEKAIADLQKAHEEEYETMKAEGKSNEEIQVKKLQNLEEEKKRLSDLAEYKKKTYGEDSDEYKEALKQKEETDKKYYDEALNALNDVRARRAEYNAQLEKESMSPEAYAKKQADREKTAAMAQIEELRKANKITQEEYENQAKIIEDTRKRAYEKIEKETAEAQRKEKEKQDEITEELLRQAEDMAIEIMEEGAAKQKKILETEYNREREALIKKRDTLAAEGKLTTEANKAINDTLLHMEEQHRKDVEAVNAEAQAEEISKHIEQEQKLIELKLQTVAEGGQEEFKLRMRLLDQQMEAELNAVGLTEEEKELIRKKYEKMRADETAKANENQVKLRNEALQEEIDTREKNWANNLIRLELQGADELTIQREVLAQRLQALDCVQRFEGESEADFQARQLQAQKDYNTQLQVVKQAEMQIRMNAANAVGQIAGAMSSMLEATGENNIAAIKLQKVLAIAEVMIAQGVAIAQATKTAAGSSFSIWDLVAKIAIGVATVTTTIVTAIKGINDAEKQIAEAEAQKNQSATTSWSVTGYATGGLVTGAGTGTSDSIPAMLSNGEFVIPAATYKAFSGIIDPIYRMGQSMSAPIPRTTNVGTTQSQGGNIGADMLSEAFAKGASKIHLSPTVSVTEINSKQNNVKAVEARNTMRV